MRVKLLAIAVLALLLCATVGATTVAVAEQQGQKGKSPVYQFDVRFYGKYGEQTVVGKLIVNTDTQTFVFNGKGLTSNREYFLVCSDTQRIAGHGRTTNAGTVHMEGAWEASVARLFAYPSFYLSDVPPTGSGSGDPFATTLTLALGTPYGWLDPADPAWHNGYLVLASGKLTDANGAGVGYAPITVTALDTIFDRVSGTVSYSTETLPDGTFSVVVWCWHLYMGGASHDYSNYQAHFAGDSVYQASESVVIPKYSY